MNKKQKQIMWAGFILIVLIGLFPPNFYRGGIWQNIIDFGTKSTDIRKLIVLWFSVVIITSVLIYLFNDKPKDKEKEGTDK
jgi:hypothetical protein